MAFAELFDCGCAAM